MLAKNPMTPKNPLNCFVALALWLVAAVILSPAAGAAEASLATGTIEGRVLHARSGEYLENARVTIDGAAREAFTDASGRYRLTQVPAGAVRVRVFFTGADPATASVTVAAGLTLERDFTLGGSSGDSVVKLADFVVTTTQEMDGAAIAINEQRFAPNISHVVSAGEFGISADGSVGEFLKFIPGISINYVGGTANTLSLDGVPGNNVPITLGGFDLASTSSASTSRATELLQISIHNVSRLEVLHSPTAESSGAALAGSVNMVPRSAFERSKPLFTGSAYVMMRDNDRSFGQTAGPRKYATRKVQPGFDFSYIAPVNKRFGFTLSGSFSKQYLPQDTVTTTWRGASAATTGTTAATAATHYPDTTPDRPYLTDYVVSDVVKFNDRSSFGTTLDYKLGTNGTLSFSYQYGRFSSEFNNNGITFFVNRVVAGGFTPTSTRGEAGRGEVRIANSSRWRNGQTHMPAIVYRYNGPIWNAEAGAGYSHSTNFLRDSARGYFGSLTARRTGVTVSFDDIFYLRPRVITVTDAAGAPVDPYSLGSYVLTAASNPQPRDSVDLRRSAYTNARRNFNLLGQPASLKGGLDVRQAARDMRGTTANYTFVGADGRATTTPTDPVGSDDGAAVLLDAPFSQRIAPYGFPRIQWLSADKAWELYQANPRAFTADANGEYRNAVSLSKRATEIISSAYLRGDLALLQRRLKLVAGLRAEQTNVQAEGPLTDPARNYQRDASGRVLRGANGAPLVLLPTSNSLGVSQLTFLDRGMHAEKEYLRVFPSLNASFNLRDNVVARGSVYTSVGRPDYNQYAGGVTLPDTETATAASRIVVNNVAIKAWSARTTKVRLEYYFEGVGQISVGGFRRDFENFFGSTVFRPTPEFLALYELDPAVYGGFDVQTQRNLDSVVRMTGLEFDYKQALTFLPRWARGVQVFANMSALRVTGEAASNFNGFVPRTYNWGVSLSRERFNVRANWNLQGRRRLGEVAVARSIEAGTFNWRSRRLNLDVQGEYRLTRSLALFANLRNVGDATEDFEIAGPNTPEHAQFRSREDYGASWTFGIKGSF